MIVIWLVVAVIVGSIWLACLVAFLFGRQSKSRLIMWLSGIPLAVITAAGVVAVGVVGFGVVRSMNPHYVYQDTFRQPPSSDVRHLRSKVWSFADTTYIFMRFEASPETFHRILPPEMQNVSFADYDQKMPSSNFEAPSWWSRPTAATSEIYIRLPEFPLSTETTLMTYDAPTRTVMYYYLEIH